MTGRRAVPRFIRSTHALMLAVVCLALSVLAGACATVPLTGRTQLNMIPDSEMVQLGITNYRQVLREKTPSHDHRNVEMVRRVGRNVAAAAESFLRQNGLENEIQYFQWEFNLLDDPQINAFCLPGGKIAVYSGILPICQTENGLAVVIGHEVAHALAKHGAERMSQGLLIQMGGIALAVALHSEPAATRNLFLAAFGLGAQVGILLPYSREHEYEADRIGLTIMAIAGYDPREAPAFWERMNRAGSEGGRPPEFLSTHPAPANRINYIRQYLPEALKYYNTAAAPATPAHPTGSLWGDQPGSVSRPRRTTQPVSPGVNRTSAKPVNPTSNRNAPPNP